MEWRKGFKWGYCRREPRIDQAMVLEALQLPGGNRSQEERTHRLTRRFLPNGIVLSEMKL